MLGATGWFLLTRILAKFDFCLAARHAGRANDLRLLLANEMTVMFLLQDYDAHGSLGSSLQLRPCKTNQRNKYCAVF